MTERRARWFALVFVAGAATIVGCDSAPQCYGVNALELQVGEGCVKPGAFGTCAPRADDDTCTAVACCAEPDDPTTLYAAPCQCPEDLRACTDDESAELAKAIVVSCSGAPTDASLDGASDAIEDAPVDAPMDVTSDATEAEADAGAE